MRIWKRAVWAVLGGAALFALGLAGLWQAGWWSPGDARRPGEATRPPAPRVEEPLAPPPQASTPPAQAPAAPEETLPPTDLAGTRQDRQDTVPLSPAAQEPPLPAPAQPAPDAPELLLAPPGAAGARTSPLLAGLNRVRARAGLQTVMAEAAWQAGCAGHARYLVRADRAEHREDPASPFRSAAGEACAPGHYFVSSRAESGPERALTYWVGGAFHLPQLIDPRLTRVASGVAHDAAGGFQSAVVLDVRRGLTGAGRYPVRYPGPGQSAPSLRAATGEWPDALAGCPPVAARGAPVALLLGPARAAEVTGVSLQVNGTPLGACLLTATTFTGANEDETRVGRGVLAAQGVALALPDAPLPAGAAVNVRFQTARGPVAWAFRTQP
ncbi:CAP domain-containing protein [Deinococcus kurensis]|uniref:CAP domain-containing protein n=1 Tax=Deinococcus kurensis TaxID=2662757 RepID=UPI0012D31253|nr:CAP domain-containing protein [Deinococcus kurensis]